MGQLSVVRFFPRTSCIWFQFSIFLLSVNNQRRNSQMRCEVCGQDYGLAHNCAGVAAAYMTEEEAAPPPAGFAPLYYLRLAFKIVCWDDVSIRRASRDFKCGLYGLFF